MTEKVVRRNKPIYKISKKDKISYNVPNKKHLRSIWKILFFFGGTRIWTQGLTFAKQVLYHVRHSLNATGHLKQNKNK
jgi:hypothetical protein